MLNTEQDKQIQPENDIYSNLHLKQLAQEFLNQPHFDIKENTILEGISGLEYNVDFFVSTNEADGQPARMLVKILDFKKPAGTDVVNKFEKASKDCSAMGLIVSNKFSAQAVSLAARTDSLLLLSRTELETIIINDQK
ncbi:MAG: restriction endonuclease [Candidatus Hodarchaeales archaeon]